MDNHWYSSKYVVGRGNKGKSDLLHVSHSGIYLSTSREDTQVHTSMAISLVTLMLVLCKENS